MPPRVIRNQGFHLIQKDASNASFVEDALNGPDFKVTGFPKPLCAVDFEGQQEMNIESIALQLRSDYIDGRA